MTNTKKKGTSLVELLAVIVIMGIIAAIAVPTVGALLKNTRKKAAGADMLTVIQSVDAYLSGADASDLTAIGVANSKFSITFGANPADAKIALIFDEDTATVEKIEGTITFTLNSSGNKVESVEFGEAKYKKDSSHTYTGFTYASGAVKCSTEQ